MNDVTRLSDSEFSLFMDKVVEFFINKGEELKFSTTFAIEGVSDCLWLNIDEVYDIDGWYGNITMYNNGVLIYKTTDRYSMDRIIKKVEETKKILIPKEVTSITNWIGK